MHCIIMGMRPTPQLLGQLLLLLQFASVLSLSPALGARRQLNIKRTALPATNAAVHQAEAHSITAAMDNSVEGRDRAVLAARNGMGSHLALLTDSWASSAVTDFQSLAVELTSTAEVLRAAARDVSSKKAELIAYRASLDKHNRPKKSHKDFGHIHRFGSAESANSTDSVARVVPSLPDGNVTPSSSTRHLRVATALGASAGFAASPKPDSEVAREAANSETVERSTLTHGVEDEFEPIEVVPGRGVNPFGTEDTAHELQEVAGQTQDTLVDAIEAAQVAEIKRSIFRALTRLRAATVKEYDTIARLETQAIDAYNDAHNYRAENPLRHLHTDESDIATDKLQSFH